MKLRMRIVTLNPVYLMNHISTGYLFTDERVRSEPSSKSYGGR